MLALCSEYADDARKKILPYSNWHITDDSHLHAGHAGQNTLKAAGQAGDAWLWVATDAQTKLVPTWLVGTRDGECAATFMHDLAERLVFICDESDMDH